MSRPRQAAHTLVGDSPPITTLRRLIDKAARNRLPVLLLGESGTGKEVVAEAIHAANPRGPFVTIDCGSLVGTLVESDLFGHVKQAFTGATSDKKGLIAMADGGTAFFDEIGDLPLELQVKLLRLIQEGEYRPVGATDWRRVDTRIIAATHRDLRAAVDAGRFRLDLYYRLNVFALRIPPLRQHKQDIPGLVAHFLDRCHTSGLPMLEISEETLALFQSYDWPGNVRELRNCVERLAAMHSEGALQLAGLPSPLQYQHSANNLANLSGALAAPDPAEPLPAVSVAHPSPIISLPDSERATIQRALAATRGERAKAARMLGIGRTTLYRKMKQYGME
ncbi:MAG: sigma-54-dependent Fis family transcriptional regulator [Acidobacteriota bacterium]|nr:sigma-54-dependent Fis family transcriptional regulator [Acidobacteriota bacterium]